MKQPVSDAPYRSVSPFRGKSWSWLASKCLPGILRAKYGIDELSVSGLEHLRESLAHGHGILLCPNHCRPSDSLLGGALTNGTGSHAYGMASWHVFRNSRLEAFVLHRVGAFSVYREGPDRQALRSAVDIVRTAERPLFIFPEGAVSTTNDRLMPLMNGVAMVARSAARKRHKSCPGSKVVIHPIAYRYQHRGDPEELLSPVLLRLERQVYGHSSPSLSLSIRIRRLRLAVQSAREVQYLGENLPGSDEGRAQKLSNLIVQRLEREWLGRARSGDIVARVKELRITIVPVLVEGKLAMDERRRLWRHLDDLHFAQCNSLNPVAYLDVTADPARRRHRLFEAVERLEEDLLDRMTNYRDLSVEIVVGEAIEVDPGAREARASDPLMRKLRTGMLNALGIPDAWPPQPVVDC